MSIKTRIEKLERKSHHPRTVVYDGKRPDIQEPGITFFRMDGLFDGRDEYFITGWSHEKALDELV